MGRSTWHQFLNATLSALAALVASGIMVSTSARTPDGIPVLPLDDSYIHLQYGWQAAHGQFLQYNPGDKPTSGASSLLYMLILAAGFRVGVSHDLMAFVVVVSGILLFVVTTVMVVDVSRQTATALGIRYIGLTGLLGGLLFAGSGWMAWAYLSGMETGLLIFAIVGALWATLHRRCWLSAAFTSMAVLTRPEAAIWAIALFVSEWHVRDPAGLTARNRRLVWAALPVVVAAIPPFVNFIFTNSFSSSGFASKSWFTIVPFSTGAIVRAILLTSGELALRLLGGAAPDGRWHVFPLFQVWAILGGWILWRQVESRRIAAMCVAWVVPGLLATATLQTATWHHYRYQMPFYPALSLLGLFGMATSTRWTKVTFAWLLLPVSAWAAYSTVDMARAYSLDTHSALHQQMALADWLQVNTPVDARLAVHDIGVMRYVGQRYTIDVVGLTTAGMSAVYRNGPGSIYEALEYSRPEYYAVYPDVAPPYFGISSTPDLLGPVLFFAEPAQYSPYTSAERIQVVTRPDWSASPLAASPQQPSVVARTTSLPAVDSLDTADLQDEIAHGYSWWNTGIPAGFPTDARHMAYRQNPEVVLADGGRRLNGGESFTLSTAPGQPLLLVARLHQMADMVLQVKVNGAEAGEWPLPSIPGEWLESVFDVSPDLVVSTRTRFEIAVVESPPGQVYSPFHYWAYQGAAPKPAPTPAVLSGIRFGDAVRLVGYDLSATSVARSQTLTATLHWQSIAPARAEHRVFVHLVDPNNDTESGIIAQHDSAPYSGTYPFWVWQPDETVSDTIALPVPRQASPGTYVLLVGIYDAASGERLPLLGGPDFGASRYLLGTITVH